MLLSIIIPCYNSDRFISNTLDMLISQGLLDCEVIVINDGSKDDTSKIVHSYAEKNPLIKIIDKENEGVSVARNTGIIKATGRYIYFLDSDDTLEDRTLDFFREVLMKNPDNKFFAFGYSSNRNGKPLKDYSFKRFDGKIIDSLLLKQSFLSKKLCFHICSCICEKQFLLENSVFFTKGLKIGEDIEFLLNILKFVPNCVYNARHCFVYKIRDDSVMQGYKSYDRNQLNSFFVITKKISEIKTEETKKDCNSFCSTFYILNLFAYLRSSCKSAEINDAFIQNKKILKQKIRFFPSKFFLIIKFLRFTPIKLILFIFRK